MAASERGGSSPVTVSPRRLQREADQLGHFQPAALRAGRFNKAQRLRTSPQPRREGRPRDRGSHRWGAQLMCGPQNRGQFKMRSAKTPDGLFRNVNTVAVVKNVCTVITQENSWGAQCTFGNRVLNSHMRSPGSAPCTSSHTRLHRRGPRAAAPQQETRAVWPPLNSSHTSPPNERR